jgi:hypothetical protein
MSQFCTIADLAAFLQIAIVGDNPSAVRAIDAATAAIKSYCGQLIEVVADDVVQLDVCVWPQRELVLPQWPVTAVAKVAEDGQELDPAFYKWSRAGILHRLYGHWRRGLQVVEVTYSHGYNPLPPEVVDVCVRAAARAYQAGLRAAATSGVAGVTSEQMADYNTQFSSERASTNEWMLGASGSPMLLRSEQEMLSSYATSGIA